MTKKHSRFPVHPALLAALALAGCKSRTFNPSETKDGQANQVSQCDARFTGKLPEALLTHYGRDGATRAMETPWVDWPLLDGNDGTTHPKRFIERLAARTRGSEDLFGSVVNSVT